MDMFSFSITVEQLVRLLRLCFLDKLEKYILIFNCISMVL